MKEWTIEISQNGWEYTGYCYIQANLVEQVDDKIVIADGITVEFDEEINLIKT